MNKISKKQFKDYIEDFDFTNLFNLLGWSYLDEKTPVKLKEETYLFQSVAEKAGFRILVFKSLKHQDLPDYATRLQIERKIGKLYREHLIIFCDKNNTIQIWQLFVKQFGKPSRLSETRWHKGQEPELLYQKTSNLFFTLDQEENITISDVVDAVNQNFSKNVEQVTKKFYENFRKEHKKFIEFIKGISVVTDCEWYASLMLNRLMFCYFIQKKGFLDNNFNYLKDKLTYCQNKKGKDKFYVSFYKNFLLALFHNGLGSPEQSEELKKEIGKIPYLNGGLFDVHELENQYENIDISDNAFENIFNFFDQYNWHLDTRITASGKDINPDVIGFIFEKYINDRAQMGAYYTKEDITDYISKNCIIPFLFDETERKYPKALKNSGTLSEVEVWKMLKESGDTYIYDAVKKGVDLPLPKEIEVGLDTSKPNLIERRKEWNKPAAEEYALPTEIWREVVDRRKRYTEIKNKIDKGEITHINDFITYNLNIRQFIQDIIDSHSDPDFIRHFYEALSTVTILDPTCGSGAFLFAAMNILEPLYESCIQRMENFVEEAPKGKYAKFEEILKYVKAPEHPNLKYFVFKNIILRNLYGVDIMKEAVEIAKLRLFLKLVASVDVDYKKTNLGLEPLPDIDFNIRAGNTLVGFATEKEIEDTFVSEMDFDNDTQKIKEKCDIVARTFKRYKEIQLSQENDYQDFKHAKDELNERLNHLNIELSLLLAKNQYGIDTKNLRNHDNPFQSWFRQHQPFHWFAEFYEIIHDKGGFDVVIGNPPYVEYSKVKNEYNIKNLQTESCGNLFAFVIEKSHQLLNEYAYFGMIIPLSFCCSERMLLLRNFTSENLENLILSNYEIFPSRLFEGAFQRVTIISGKKSLYKNNFRYVSKLHRWYSIERGNMIERITYTKLDEKEKLPLYGKFQSRIHLKIIEQISKSKTIVAHFCVRSNPNHFIYYQEATNYWMKAATRVPYYKKNGKIDSPAHGRFIYFEKDIIAQSTLALLNSSLFYLWYITYSDGFHLSDMLVRNFPSEENLLQNEVLIKLGEKLEKDIEINSIRTTRNTKTDQIEIESFKMNLSKPIIDEIDTVLAEHYGFTEEELDFIINYDIKYRMGKELEEDV